jgi:hypothetical protein
MWVQSQIDNAQMRSHKKKRTVKQCSTEYATKTYVRFFSSFFPLSFVLASPPAQRRPPLWAWRASVGPTSRRHVLAWPPLHVLLPPSPRHPTCFSALSRPVRSVQIAPDFDLRRPIPESTTTRRHLAVDWYPPRPDSFDINKTLCRCTAEFYRTPASLRSEAVVMSWNFRPAKKRVGVQAALGLAVKNGYIEVWRRFLPTLLNSFTDQVFLWNLINGYYCCFFSFSRFTGSARHW